MTKEELEALAAVMAGVIKEQVGAATRPLVERIAHLEASQPEDPDLSSDAMREMITEAISALPKPEDGKSVTAEDVRPLIEECVVKAVGALPTAKDGNPGKDGVGVAGALIDRSGNLVLTLSDGSTRELGLVVGKDGEDGLPGKDGFNLEDFDATVMDDGRTVLLSFERGDFSYKVELGFPVMLYRGVFTEGEYERGDTVTWAGSLWHCDAEKTTEKPGDGSNCWKLAAKRGRDGRDSPKKSEKPNLPIRVGVPAKEH